MDRELQHTKTALQHCQFPSWASTVATQVLPSKPAQNHHHHHQQQQQQQPSRQQQKQHHHSSPIYAQHREKFKKLCIKKGIQVHFKGTNTLWTALGNPKDKDPKPTKQGSYITTNAHK